MSLQVYDTWRSYVASGLGTAKSSGNRVNASKTTGIANRGPRVLFNHAAKDGPQRCSIQSKSASRRVTSRQQRAPVAGSLVHKIDLTWHTFPRVVIVAHCPPSYDTAKEDPRDWRVLYVAISRTFLVLSAASISRKRSRLLAPPPLEACAPPPPPCCASCSSSWTTPASSPSMPTSIPPTLCVLAAAGHPGRQDSVARCSTFFFFFGRVSQIGKQKNSAARRYRRSVAEGTSSRNCVLDSRDNVAQHVRAKIQQEVQKRRCCTQDGGWVVAYDPPAAPPSWIRGQSSGKEGKKPSSPLKPPCGAGLVRSLAPTALATPQPTRRLLPPEPGVGCGLSRPLVRLPRVSPASPISSAPRACIVTPCSLLGSRGLPAGFTMGCGQATSCRINKEREDTDVIFGRQQARTFVARGWSTRQLMNNSGACDLHRCTQQTH